MDPSSFPARWESATSATGCTEGSPSEDTPSGSQARWSVRWARWTGPPLPQRSGRNLGDGPAAWGESHRSAGWTPCRTPVSLEAVAKPGKSKQDFDVSAWQENPSINALQEVSQLSLPWYINIYILYIWALYIYIYIQAQATYTKHCVYDHVRISNNHTKFEE